MGESFVEALRSWIVRRAIIMANHLSSSSASVPGSVLLLHYHTLEVRPGRIS